MLSTTHGIGRGRLSRSAAFLLFSVFVSSVTACGSDADEPAPPAEPGLDAGDGDANGDDIDAGTDADPEVDAGPDASDEPVFTRFEVTPDEASVVERRTVQLSAKPVDQFDEEFEIDIDVVTWTSSDEELATVDEMGLVTTIRPGTVTITASASGKSGEATITITESTVASLELHADPTEISVDADTSLEVVVKDAEGYELLGRTVVFESANEDIAVVSDDGTITGTGPGEVAIRAKVDSVEEPIDIRVFHRFTKLAAGPYQTCGFTVRDRAWCWGANGNGQLGNGETMATQSVPVRVAVDDAFRTIVMTEHAACGLTQSDEVWCWGDNINAGLGVPKDDVPTSPTPIRLTDRSYQALSAMGHAFCGLDADGHAHCWGYSNPNYFEFGDPSFSGFSHLPVAAHAPEGEDDPVAFTELRQGFNASCGSTAGGKLYCWGRNDDYQLGDGTRTHRALAVAPLGDEVVESFDLGYDFACAATADATYCWGRNAFGQAIFGGDQDGIAEPTPRFGEMKVASFALGYEHGCLLDEDGQAHCWGNNRYLQLGRSMPQPSLDVGAIESDLRFTQLVSGHQHVCGLATDGKAYCWGNNASGELGVDAPTPTKEPMMVVGQ